MFIFEFCFIIIGYNEEYNEIFRYIEEYNDISRDNVAKITYFNNSNYFNNSLYFENLYFCIIIFLNYSSNRFLFVSNSYTNF